MKIFHNNNDKAQSLPLNTIVIALLVVIVLVVVVLAFTGNIGQANETISENNAGACSSSNPAISTFYSSERYTISPTTSCSASNQEVIPGINAGDGQVCCATEKSSGAAPESTGTNPE